MAKMITVNGKARVTINYKHPYLVTPITETVIKYGDHKVMDMIETIIVRECDRSNNSCRRLAKALNPKGRRTMAINLKAENCTLLIEFGRRCTRLTLIMDSGDEFQCVYSNDQYIWLWDYAYSEMLYRTYKTVAGKIYGN